MTGTPRTHPSRRTAVLVVAVVACVAVLVAGGVGWHRYSGRASVLTTDSGLRVVVGERVESSMTAAFEGVVTRVGRCIGLGDTFTVWPHGTRVVAGDRIRVGGTTYGLGDRFTGGGGFLEQDSGDRSSRRGVPAGCPVTAEVLIVAEPEGSGG